MIDFDQYFDGEISITEEDIINSIDQIKERLEELLANSNLTSDGLGMCDTLERWIEFAETY